MAMPFTTSQVPTSSYIAMGNEKLFQLLRDKNVLSALLAIMTVKFINTVADKTLGLILCGVELRQRSRRPFILAMRCCHASS